MESPARPPPIIATLSLGLPLFGGGGSSGYKDLKGASFGETSFKTGPRSVTAAASMERIVSGGLSTPEIDSLFYFVDSADEFEGVWSSVMECDRKERD